MSAAFPAKAGGLLPLAGICCLALTGFLIATTIVLALIPIYTPRKSVTVVNTPEDADKFQLQFSATPGNENDTVSGSIGNLDDIRSALGLGDDVEITDGFVQSDDGDGARRRRRTLLQRRQTAIGIMLINIVCKYKIKSDCRGNCRIKKKAKIGKAIAAVGSLSNFPLTVNYGGLTYITSGLKLLYTEIKNQPSVPEGFGAITDLNFVPIASGDITSRSIWKNGIRPFRGCNVTVPEGLTLNISKSPCRMPIESLTVAKGAILALGTAGSSGFQFTKIKSFVIGGTCSFLGSGGSIRFPSTSTFKFEIGALYTGVSVAFQAYNFLTGLDVTGAFFSLIPGVTITSIISFISGIITSGGTTALANVTTSTVATGGTGITGGTDVTGGTDFTSTAPAPTPGVG